jgi:hypothetical protein
VFVLKKDPLTMLYKALSPLIQLLFEIFPAQNIRQKVKNNSARLALHVISWKYTKHADNGYSRKQFLTLPKFMEDVIFYKTV